MNLQKALAVVFAGSLALALSPVATAAKGFNYSYADVGYQLADGDDVDFNSGMIDASFGIFDMFALRGVFRQGQTDDIPGEDLNITEFRFGGRGHYKVMEKLDVFGDVLAFSANFNSDNRTFNDTGAIYEAGVRFKAAKKLELNTSYRYFSGDIDEGFGTIGAVFKLTKVFAATANASFGSDVNEYFAGIRLNF
ncbi:hypothetical protein MNBD_GAMMA15-151 [hydrothermal vent metagenome]|uniref:Outer membrane protein beta-barrel domain-containing protein n=1 Tax=hydrothermal vent metagenome TaxID=652676 RepID=A0A3B0YIH1_9ZZZZ